MKKLLSGFLFTGVLICCTGLLVSGSITASQKSAKNTFDRAYAVMSVKNSGERLEITMGQQQLSFTTDIGEKIKRYEDYIILTPAATVYYFGKTAAELFRTLKSG